MHICCAALVWFGVGVVAVPCPRSRAPWGAVGDAPHVMLLQTHKQTVTWLRSPAEHCAGRDRQGEHYSYWISPSELVLI